MLKIKDLLFRLSGVFILLSALIYLFEPIIAPWIMAVSVAIFTIITMITPYPGNSIRGKRLHNFQIFACIFMIVGNYLMFKQRSEWPLLMIIAALLLLYSAIVIPKAFEDENKDL